jgi:hypothetical protein
LTPTLPLENLNGKEIGAWKSNPSKHDGMIRFLYPYFFSIFCIDKNGDKNGASLVFVILERSD